MTATYTPILPTVDDATVFPVLAGQSFLSSKSPVWATGVATAASGRERRRQKWSYPKWRFRVAYEVISDKPSLAELARLFGFFNNHAGQFANFSYYDPTDNLATNQQFGTGDGTTKTFQLQRTGGYGTMTWVEPCKSILGTPKVSVGVTDTTTFTIDATTGKLTFATAPASGAALTWSGQFMFRVRFEADQIDPQQMMQGLWSLQGIGFVSDKR